MIAVRCKYCGFTPAAKNGTVNGEQVYRCRMCGRRFYGNGRFAKMKTGRKVIVAALNLYYEGLSLRKTQRVLETIYGKTVSQVAILGWIRKYSALVAEYAATLTPQLSGMWHEDETVVSCERKNVWFWQMIDEDTKFLVASHLSDTRTLQDTITIFQKGLEQAKIRPRAVFVDGSLVYEPAFNHVFWTLKKSTRPQLVQRVGIRTRETNNIVERLHGTVKDRIGPARGFKSFPSTKRLLEGFAVHYNFVRPHQSLGRTPAQAARTDAPTGWADLIDVATRREAELLAKATRQPKAAKMAEVIVP